MNEIGKSPHVASRDQALAIAYSIKRRGRAEGGAADDDYLMPPPDASLGLSGNPYFGLPGKVAAGMAQGVLSLPQRAFGASENMRQGGDYDPGPILEAATLPMAGGLAAPVGMRAGEAALGAGPIRAYHGSPYDFDKFDLSKIGTGEGAQAYGHGLYFAERPEVAKIYKEQLAARNNQRPVTVPGPFGDDISILESDPSRPGKTYEVSINADPEHFLDWDAPLSEQPENVRNALSQLGQSQGNKYLPRTGESAVQSLGTNLGGKDKATEALRSAGIPGIKYLDQGSRGDSYFVSSKSPDQFSVMGPGNVSHGDFASRAEANAAAEAKNESNRTRNYVVFDDSLISILRKYGLIPGAAGLGAAAKSSQSGDTGMADGGALSTAFRVKRDGYAFGGPPAPWQVRAEARGMLHTGPIPSIVPGRTDNHNMSVPSGAYVVPAQAVSHLGQNNTNAGMAVLSRMFGHSGPYGVGTNPAIRPGHTMPRPPGLPKISDTGGARGMADDVGKPVPIAAAGGEFVIHPADVAKVGGGDVTKGHQVLDKWVNKIKEDHIRTLRKLPGPAKS